MINYVCFYELWMNYNYRNTVLFYLKLDGIYEERIYNNIDKKKKSYVLIRKVFFRKFEKFPYSLKMLVTRPHRMHYWQVIFWHSPPEEIRGN